MAQSQIRSDADLRLVLNHKRNDPTARQDPAQNRQCEDLRSKSPVSQRPKWVVTVTKPGDGLAPTTASASRRSSGHYAPRLEFLVNPLRTKSIWVCSSYSMLA